MHPTVARQPLETPQEKRTSVPFPWGKLHHVQWNNSAHRWLFCWLWIEQLCQAAWATPGGKIQQQKPLPCPTPSLLAPPLPHLVSPTSPPPQMVLPAHCSHYLPAHIGTWWWMSGAPTRASACCGHGFRHVCNVFAGSTDGDNGLLDRALNHFAPSMERKPHLLTFILGPSLPYYSSVMLLLTPVSKYKL